VPPQIAVLTVQPPMPPGCQHIWRHAARTSRPRAVRTSRRHAARTFGPRAARTTQAPRSQGVQAARSAGLTKAATLVREADVACKAGNTAVALEKAKAAMELLKK